jgi:ferredoxin
MTHNYREKLGGFVNWVHTLADSRNRRDYRRRVSDAETLSWWQSLGYEANTHCDYCVSVCPAGEVEPAYRANPKDFFRDYVRPLRERAEAVYVVKGSDAEAHVMQKFPGKRPRLIGRGMTASSIANFIDMLPHLFQRGQAKGISACYHFLFRGREEAEATVEIRDQQISVQRGLVGSPNMTVIADSEAWLGFLAKNRSLVWELIRRRVRLQGNPALLLAFGRCFPS